MEISKEIGVPELDRQEKLEMEYYSEKRQSNINLLQSDRKDFAKAIHNLIKERMKV